jgi:hypothetical protein
MNADGNMDSSISDLKTEGHIDEDIKIVQASKDKETDQSQKPTKNKGCNNKHKKEQIDITAESLNRAKGMGKPSTPIKVMRVRSHHSRIGLNGPKPDNSKDDSQKKSTKEHEISKKVKITEPLLRKVVESKLTNYLNKNKTYSNGLIRIIADPDFLIACYMLIKGKSGNMTKGIDGATLDGINLE